MKIFPALETPRLMKKALNPILTYGFAAEGLDNVVAEVMPENIASKQLSKKLKFQRQGVLKKRGF